MYYPMMGIDSTYILVVIGMVICLLASNKMNSTYRKYARVQSYSGVSAREVAEQILRREGIYDVRVDRISGDLTDHYDPKNKVLRLSDATYSSTSVAAIGVAAHECGHAIQHARGYAPLSFRSILVPIANFGTGIAWPLILLGLLFNSQSSYLFIQLGILAFSAGVLFQLVTLPVEFDASKRAIRVLGDGGILREEELKVTKKVLGAAALTYVAGASASVLQLLRLILLSNRRR